MLIACSCMRRLAAHGNIDLDVFVDNNRIKRVASSESLNLTIDKTCVGIKILIDISGKVD